MKLIHLSDLHIGKRVNEFSMLEDQKYILQEILSILDEEKPDGVLIAGDIYDKAVPSAEAVELVDHFLNELAKRKLETFVISGNHDSAERIAFGCQLMDGSGIHMSPVYHGQVRPVTMYDEYGPLDIWMLPFIRPANVRQYCLSGENTKPETGEEITESAEQPPVREKNDQPAVPEDHDDEPKKPSAPPCTTYEEAMKLALSVLPVDRSRRNILITHQFVTGASRTDSEEKSLGGTDNIDASVFAGFDYVALGHIHRPQNMALGHDSGSPIIRYSGSPLKYSFSECDDEKSVTVLEIGKKTMEGEASATEQDKNPRSFAEPLDQDAGKQQAPSDFIRVRTVPLQPLHDMRQLRGSYSELTLRTNYEGTATDDYLHITLTDEEDIPDAMRRLQTIYPNLMRLDYDNTRTRSDGHLLDKSAAVVQTPMEMMNTFYQEQNGQALNEEQKTYLEGLIASIFRQ